jgi:hypothetical protein
VEAADHGLEDCLAAITVVLRTLSWSQSVRSSFRDNRTSQDRTDQKRRPAIDPASPSHSTRDNKGSQGTSRNVNALQIV